MPQKKKEKKSLQSALPLFEALSQTGMMKKNALLQEALQPLFFYILAMSLNLLTNCLPTFTPQSQPYSCLFLPLQERKKFLKPTMRQSKKTTVFFLTEMQCLFANLAEIIE